MHNERKMKKNEIKSNVQNTPKTEKIKGKKELKSK